MTATATEYGPLPRVQGRHRSKALAARRKIAAVQMVGQGKTMQQVAEQLGYAARGLSAGWSERP